MNEELQYLVEWLKANKLSLNESKTELIIFCSINKPCKFPHVRSNDFELKPCQFVTYLGVTIDEVLSWNKQIELICSKLSRTNGIMSKLRYYVPQKTCISIYYCLFQSYILYGCLSWSFTSQYNIEKLILLQKKKICLIGFAHYNEHTDPLFKSLQITKIKDVFTIQIAKFVYQFTNGTLPESINHLFSLVENVHSHDTRYPNKIHIPHVNSLRYGTLSLRYSGPCTFNKLLRIKTLMNHSMSIYALKNSLKNHFLGTI